MKRTKYNSISIIVPAYNEENNIKPLIERVHVALSKNKIKYEIIIVDDNSTDATRSIASELASTYPVILHVKKGKQGKAYSIHEGMQYVQYEAVAMIDADLQYPPEELPEMIEKLANADVVVANRKHYHDSLLRKVLSNTFRFTFGKGLFGLENDIQAGLKVFSREVFETIKFKPSSSWTLDLEFLHRTRQAGFVIINHDIVFSKRESGASKINFVRQTFEIGTNALLVRAKKIQPLSISPVRKGSMIGAGVGYKTRRYITHTTINHDASAIKTFTASQLFVIFATVFLIIMGIILSPLFTLQILVAVLSFIYFADVVFNLFLIIKSLSLPSEVSSTPEEIEELNDKDLPIYTILCPLYKEGRIIPQFLDAMSKLSWPKEKLDIILLLEEDDKESLALFEKMDLPSYVRGIVVPDSLPKTKPKACNYGLGFAKGEYLVIFDAEDVPDPLQLKKAYLGFKKVNKDVICLQAKLNYYNPNQNLLTRFFTAEYSLWFDITLTGLQSIETTIPLGGTSNHFKVESLHEVEGWDPFNVTEDADLGVRLFKKGFKTAIIDSITLEEANSRVGNWLRQRSRWIKGYMQTYLVHIRESSSFAKKQGVHALIFQLTIGGKIAFVLINPFLWIATISYFALYAYVGPQIEALYPSAIFYMAVSSLVLGNFLFLYYYMIGVAKKGQWDLMKYIFLIPIYWLMISVAAAIALYQLIFKPHYWEKTVHGLHLAKKTQEVVEAIEEVVEEEVVEMQKKQGFTFTPVSLSKLRLKISNFQLVGLLFVGATGIGSVLNFFYSTYLGRVLNLENFALISLISGLFSIVSLVSNSFGNTVKYKTGYSIGREGEQAAYHWWSFVRSKALIISVFVTIAWVVLTPFITNFFKVDSIIPFILFAPVLAGSLLYEADRGFLSSKLKFGLIAGLVIFEPLIKLVASIVLVTLGLGEWAYAAVPFSFVVTIVAGWIVVLRMEAKHIGVKPTAPLKVDFPKKFFGASMVNSIASLIFLNMDIVLAKHYLSPSEAGIYALVSLIGKMIFFLGSFVAPFITPLVSRNEGEGKDSTKVLNLILLSTALFTLPGFVALGFFGDTIAPLLFGEKAVSVVPYLLPFSFAMLLFSFARVIRDYYLTKKNYTFTITGLVLAFGQIVLIARFHDNVGMFVNVMSIIWSIYFVLMLVLHLGLQYVKTFENNITDFLGVFEPLKRQKVAKSDKYRILIFNWRDTKHKWAGGAEVYVHELAKRLVAEGNSVTLFAGNGTRNLTDEVIDGVRIYRRGGFYTVYLWAFVYYFIHFRRKFDIIIDSENGIPFFTPLYTGRRKFLLIHHVHQEVFRKSLAKPFSTIALFLEAKLMPFVYRNVQVITVSPSSKNEIMRLKLTKKEPLVIYNGVDLTSYKVAPKTSQPVILYLGRLQYYKSLNVLLIAAKKVLRKFPQATFIIAGEGEEKNKLIGFAEKLGILDKVRFVGHVSESEKINLMQKAWVFVNPSFMEGWGITTIEAAACGTPTVASDVPGLRDSVKDKSTGYLVKYRDFDGFAKSIIRLIERKSTRQRMSKEASLWAQGFNWDKSTTELLSAIDSELAKKDRGFITTRVTYLVDRISSLL